MVQRSQRLCPPLGARQTASLLSRPAKLPYGRLWPNGEFSLGTARENLEECERTAIDLARLNNADHQRAVLQELRDSGTLGLSTLRNSHKPNNRPETYGRRGITPYGRRCVRSAAYLLEKESPRRTLSFLTLTLPPMTQEAQLRVAAQWGEIVNRLLQFLQRKLQRQGLPPVIVSVSELQSKRLKSSPLSALHVHVLFQGRSRSGLPWAVSCREIRLWWLNKLSLVAGEFVESSACENIQVVRKSPERYLGKYLSKGSAGAERIAQEFGWAYVPRQWWNMSASARQAVKANTFSGQRTGAALERIVNDWLSDPQGHRWGWMMPVTIAFDDLSLVIGWSGRVNSAVAREIRAMLTST